jgi:predicted MFS family arabinose efflux permease
MWQATIVAIRDSRIRNIAVALLLLGFTYASTIPYQSIIGIEQLGLSERQMGLLIFGIGLSGMIGNLTLGYLSDYAQNRKTSVLISLAVGFFGFGAFATWPSVTTFLICCLLINPISGSAYSQLFAIVRTMTIEKGDAEAASINSAVRTFYALSWIVVPGLVGLFIATRKNVSDSFAIAALAFGLCFVFYALFGPKGGRTQISGKSAWNNLREAFGLIFEARVFRRLIALSFIQGPHPLIAAALPLIITSLPHGGTADVGFLAGLFAALEIPIMLVAGMLNRNWHTWTLIIIGALTHVSFLLAVGLASNVASIYAFAIFNAAGTAIMVTLHVSYVQELLPERPGLATSLLSITTLVNRTLSAFVFAGIGLVYSYAGAMTAMAFLALLGSVAIYLLDRRDGLRRVINHNAE